MKKNLPAGKSRALPGALFFEYFFDNVILLMG
jgi:hypothetical protein